MQWTNASRRYAIQVFQRAAQAKLGARDMVANPQNCCLPLNLRNAGFPIDIKTHGRFRLATDGNEMLRPFGKMLAKCSQKSIIKEAGDYIP